MKDVSDGQNEMREKCCYESLGSYLYNKIHSVRKPFSQLDNGITVSNKCPLSLSRTTVNDFDFSVDSIFLFYVKRLFCDTKNFMRKVEIK